MEAEDKKYEKILNMLRISQPVLSDKDIFDVTEKVMRHLQEGKSKVNIPELIIEFLFGWVYIGWVRKSMVAVAVVIAVVFGYQQALIIKRINDLSGQRIQNGSAVMTNLKDEITDKIMIYRFKGGRFADERKTISEREIDELIKSLNKLQVKYKDLFYIIENDPELKKYIEDRIKETNEK
jgi:hypothetical protein